MDTEVQNSSPSWEKDSETPDWSLVKERLFVMCKKVEYVRVKESTFPVICMAVCLSLSNESLGIKTQEYTGKTRDYRWSMYPTPHRPKRQETDQVSLLLALSSSDATSERGPIQTEYRACAI